MKKILLILAFLILPAMTLIRAQTPAASPVAVSPSAPQVPDIVTEGFRSFMTGGYASATSTWTRNSAMSLDSMAVQVVNNVFLQHIALAGNFTGADVIRVVNLSLSTEEVYCAVKYQRGVLFMSFTCYKTATAWIITGMVVDKDPAKVLPTNIMGGL